MSKTNLIEDELDLLIDSVLEAAPPDLKARCVKEDILVALRIYLRRGSAPPR